MITESDIPGFFAEKKDLHLEDYVLLDYLFETNPKDNNDPRLTAAQLCSEQSTAQWSRPGTKEDFRERFGAKTVDLKEVGKHRFRVQIAHPHRNFGPRIPNFLAAAAGEGPFYCPGIRTIKWMDFSWPGSFLKHFEGPRIGLEGLRQQLGVTGRPIFIGVVKPNIGLPPADFAALAGESWKGGLDICKDDEMLADVEWSPLVERVRLVTEARRRIEKETGLKKIFIANITDEVDRIAELHDRAVQNGANAVMINSILTGISALRVLSSHSKVPVMSHFAGTAALSRQTDHGISSLVLTKLQRLAGADIIGLAGFGERMGCTEDEVLANVRACLEPLGNLKAALPVPGGSDTAETLPAVFKKIGHVDFGFICGRGVFGHSAGPAAGAQTLHKAWGQIAGGR